MLAELRLQAHFPLLLMPVPRALSADCGMVIRIDDKDCDEVVALLQKEQLSPFTTYRLVGKEFELLGEFP